MTVNKSNSSAHAAAFAAPILYAAAFICALFGRWSFGSTEVCVLAVAAAVLSVFRTGDRKWLTVLLAITGPVMLFYTARTYFWRGSPIFLYAALLCLLGAMRFGRGRKNTVFQLGYYLSLWLNTVPAAVALCTGEAGVPEMILPLAAGICILTAQTIVMAGCFGSVSGLFGPGEDAAYEISPRLVTAAAVLALCTIAVSFALLEQSIMSSRDYSGELTVWIRFISAGLAILALWKMYGSSHKVFLIGLSAVLVNYMYTYIIGNVGVEPELWNGVFYYGILAVVFTILILRAHIRRWLWPVPAVLTVSLLYDTVSRIYILYGAEDHAIQLICLPVIAVLFSVTLAVVCYGLRTCGSPRRKLDIYPFEDDTQPRQAEVEDKKISPVTAAAVCFGLFVLMAFFAAIDYIPGTVFPAASDTEQVTAEQTEDTLRITYMGQVTSGFLEPKGTEIQLDVSYPASGEPAESNVEWSSSDETVAVVQDGLVKLVGRGACTVTASDGIASAAIDVWCE